jgi:hypothetical protein
MAAALDANSLPLEKKVAKCLVPPWPTRQISMVTTDTALVVSVYPSTTLTWVKFAASDQAKRVRTTQLPFTPDICVVGPNNTVLVAEVRRSSKLLLQAHLLQGPTWDDAMQPPRWLMELDVEVVRDQRQGAMALAPNGSVVAGCYRDREAPQVHAVLWNTATGLLSRRIPLPFGTFGPSPTLAFWPWNSERLIVCGRAPREGVSRRFRDMVPYAATDRTGDSLTVVCTVASIDLRAEDDDNAIGAPLARCHLPENDYNRTTFCGVMGTPDHLAVLLHRVDLTVNKQGIVVAGDPRVFPDTRAVCTNVADVSLPPQPDGPVGTEAKDMELRNAEGRIVKNVVSPDGRWVVVPLYDASSCTINVYDAVANAYRADGGSPASNWVGHLRLEYVPVDLVFAPDSSALMVVETRRTSRLGEIRQMGYLFHRIDLAEVARRRAADAFRTAVAAAGRMGMRLPLEMWEMVAGAAGIPRPRPSGGQS